MDWQTQIVRNCKWTELESLQDEYVEKVRAHRDCAFFLLSEPEPTFTHGKSANLSDLLWDKSTLSQHNATATAVSRGGKWTYHGPGQILLFPIVDVRSLGYDSREVRAFVEDFRQGIANWIFSKVKRKVSLEGPSYGLFIEDKKIASFGVDLRGGICKHGVSIYLKPQSKYFGGVMACGVKNSTTTSLEELDSPLEWEQVAKELVPVMKKSFRNQ